MFETLTEKLSEGLRRVRGQHRLTEENIQSALQEVRTALLEADVHFRVVREFLRAVQERALGEAVPAGLTAGQYFIKIVSDELARMMGGAHQALRLEPVPPTVILLVGLQGSGKTSTAGKLARMFQQEGKRPYLVPADPYRPAAIEQLQTLARALGVESFPATAGMDPVEIARQGVARARAAGAEIVLIDTAGRLHLDEELMAELRDIRSAVRPAEILFVADGMTGQDAVNTASAFHEQLGLTGHILTKMDGDARGGAALSIRAITQQPIKFMTVGEKVENLERFHPDRVASRILGMGDLVSLIEKAQQSFDQKQAQELQDKLRRDEFTLSDFLDQIRGIRRMGPMKDLLEMMPGMAGALKGASLDEGQLTQIEAIICSMTPAERAHHHVINMSRRNRIARGSGTRTSDVNRLLKQFAQMRKMMKRMSAIRDPRRAMQMARSFFPG
jgi:signal recognition particle subunit SRP54